MPNKKKVLKLRDEIDQILWKDWDPIGVNDDPDAKGEYTSYADTICSKLIKIKKDRQAILDYLFWIETDFMGFTPYMPNKEIYNNRISSVVEKIFKIFSENSSTK